MSNFSNDQMTGLELFGFSYIGCSLFRLERKTPCGAYSLSEGRLVLKQLCTEEITWTQSWRWSKFKYKYKYKYKCKCKYKYKYKYKYKCNNKYKKVRLCLTASSGNLSNSGTTTGLVSRNFMQTNKKLKNRNNYNFMQTNKKTEKIIKYISVSANNAIACNTVQWSWIT